MFSGSSSVLMDVTMVTDPELILSDHLSPRVSGIVMMLINDVIVLIIGVINDIIVLINDVLLISD